MLAYSFPAVPCALAASARGPNSPKAGPALALGTALGTAGSCKVVPPLLPLPPHSIRHSNPDERVGHFGARKRQLSTSITLVSFHCQMPDSFRTSDSNPTGRACSHGPWEERPQSDRCLSVPRILLPADPQPHCSRLLRPASGSSWRSPAGHTPSHAGILG